MRKSEFAKEAAPGGLQGTFASASASTTNGREVAELTLVTLVIQVTPHTLPQ